MDVEGVGGPDGGDSVSQPSCEVLVLLRDRSRSDLLYVFDGFGVAERWFLAKHFCFLLCELLGHFLLEVLQIYKVAAVVGLLGEESSNVEETCVSPAVDDSLADVHVFALLELLLLGQLSARMQHEEEGAEAGPRVGFTVIVAVLRSHLPQGMRFVEKQFLGLGFSLRLLLLLLFVFLLLGVFLEVGLSHHRLCLFGDFGQELLLAQRFLLACELDLEIDFANASSISLNIGIVERISQLLLDFLLLKRNALASLDGVNVDEHFRDAVG